MDMRRKWRGVATAGLLLAAGTFWSSLIDDIRIYNRAVKP